MFTSNAKNPELKKSPKWPKQKAKEIQIKLIKDWKKYNHMNTSY